MKLNNFLSSALSIIGVIALITSLSLIALVAASFAAPTVNPALRQNDYFQNLYAITDTLCCHASHWDVIIPVLDFSGDWTIYPYGARSKKADGLNVKVKMAGSDNGWSETFFIPCQFDSYKNELTAHRWFSTAIDTLAVQAAFSTCAVDSVLSYQFIMQGW